MLFRRRMPGSPGALMQLADENLFDVAEVKVCHDGMMRHC